MNRRTNNAALNTFNINSPKPGWRLAQERNGSNVPPVSYTRGNDLSGSMEGAGGIGGLLARSGGHSSGTWSDHNFYHADGNGNVTYLVNSSQGLAARYKYDAYGNTLSQSGTLANANVYQFSSKEQVVIDPEGIFEFGTLYYYGYRFYAPNLQSEYYDGGGGAVGTGTPV